MPTGVFHRPSLADRVWSRVDRRGAADHWPAAVKSIFVAGRISDVVTQVYSLVVRPLHPNERPKRVCGFPGCANPDHQTVVERKTNAHKGPAKRTHCKRGHEFTPDNTHAKADGTRGCRTCRNETSAVWAMTHVKRDKTARKIARQDRVLEVNNEHDFV